jgi:serine protease Do
VFYPLALELSWVTMRPMTTVGHRTSHRLSLAALVLLLATLVFVLASGCAADRLFAPSRERVIQRILPASVQVVLEEGGRRVRSGSGVVIAARSTGKQGECLVLTAGHTLAGMTPQQEVTVFLERHRGPGARLRATVLAQRETDDVDLGLLRIESNACLAAPFGVPPDLGDAVWVVAFPWGRNMTLTGGHVSQIDLDGPALGDGAPRLMVDASVSYGASGGGVFEASTGRLIGLVEGYRTARVSFKGESALRYIDVPVPGETYVTSLIVIRRFLTEAGYGSLISAR